MNLLKDEWNRKDIEEFNTYLENQKRIEKIYQF